ncbi:hypothetical protein SAMN05421690_102532 [Nitrosomonas sp. Nm51]|nr:hypothetical protein SAMN05421690_102532 [Nitrosomonas sp. Nm51]
MAINRTAVRFDVTNNGHYTKKITARLLRIFQDHKALAAY